MDSSLSLTQTATKDISSSNGLKLASNPQMDKKCSPINHGPFLSTISKSSMIENLSKKKSLPRSTILTLPEGFHNFLNLLI